MAIITITSSPFKKNKQNKQTQNQSNNNMKSTMICDDVNVEHLLLLSSHLEHVSRYIGNSERDERVFCNVCAIAVLFVPSFFFFFLCLRFVIRV